MKLIEIKNTILDYKNKFFYVLIFYIIYNIYILLNEQKTRHNLKLENILDRAINKNGNFDDFFGTWRIDDKNYPVKEFSIKKENIIYTINKNDKHYICSKSKYIYNSDIIYIVNIPLSCVKFKNYLRPIHTYLSHESNYRFVLHKNGVIKFIANNDSKFNKLMLARTESKSLFDLINNIQHSKKYGCFCLGILTKYKTIERYNRWNNKKIDKYWTAYKIN